jgi:hypothetical protein
MKFSVGDRVLLKRTGEEGHIISFLSKQMVEVEVGETRFPVYADELDHPYLKWFTDPKVVKTRKVVREIPEEKSSAKAIRLSRGIYLSFLPQFVAGSTDDIVEAFRIHLLNETAEHINFSYHARTAKGESLLQLNGVMHPFANIFLHTLTLEEMNEQPRFGWEVAPIDKPAIGVRDTLRIRPAQLIRHINTLIQEGTPAFSILLTQDAEGVVSLPVFELKQAPLTTKTEEPKNVYYTEAQEVLDLHPEALDEVNDELSAGEILTVQINVLERKIDAAYRAGLERMVVIHGIGNGVLRDAVHDTIRNTQIAETYSNQWMPGYGWGATEVVFKRS